MFSGSPGTGKTTITNIMATAYQCAHMPADKWGDPCDECWKRWSSFAIHDLNASSVNGIDALKEVVDQSRYRPTYVGGKRVIILNEAHNISRQAQDMLLAPTEKAMPHLVWIICTTDPNKLLPALQRRFTTYKLKGLSFSDVEKFVKLSAARSKVTKPLDVFIEQLHFFGVNAPALVLQALDKYAAGGTAQEAVVGVDEGVESLRICKAVTSGKWSEVVSAMKDATPDSARLIRASVSGWLVGCLKRENNPKGQERAALSLVELSQFPFDDAAMLHWIWGALWKITRRYGQ
jgi:DNA polymerase-3 subunit gamma/tau